MNRKCAYCNKGNLLNGLFLMLSGEDEASDFCSQRCMIEWIDLKLSQKAGRKS